jgi:ABC-type enterochelin transport system permease subunit
VSELIIAALIGALIIFSVGLLPFVGFAFTLVLGFNRLGVLVWTWMQNRLPSLV